MIGDGDNSVYTEFEELEVMFLVSTMLRHNPSDPKQIAKKRHISNCCVVIIYKDSDSTEPFFPSVIKSGFTRKVLWKVNSEDVYIVVQKSMLNARYK